MKLKNKNFIELNNEIYCLDDIKYITYNTDSKKYELYFDYIIITILEEEYNYIKNLIKKYSNSYNIY